MWEIASMDPKSRPAFDSSFIKLLLQVDLQANAHLDQDHHHEDDEDKDEDEEEDVSDPGGRQVDAETDAHLAMMMQIGAVECSIGALWWLASAKWDSNGDKVLQCSLNVP
jgi:hypothetical protein